MEEKHEAIWISVEEDGSAKIIFEEYLCITDKLHVIYQQADGCFVPYSYVKENNSQWQLPVWIKENEKALLPTLELAKEYLTGYAASNT